MKEEYNKLVKKYLDKFCEKQECEIEYTIGDYEEVVCVAEAYLQLSDIMYDVDNNISKGIIFEWYWKTIGNGLIMNFKNYSKYGEII